MIEHRITLKEIARQCDLAPTTVSSILHGRHTYCSQSKINMVMQLVKKYNYRPNVGYSIMTGRETNIIAVVFSQKRVTQHDMLQTFYMNLCTRLNEQNYAMYTAILSTEWETEKKSLDSLIERGCRTFIFIGTPRNYKEIHNYLSQRKIRTLGFNNHQETNGCVCAQAKAFVCYLERLEKRGIRNIRIAFPTERIVNEFLPLLPKEKQDFYLSCSMDVPPVGYYPGSSAIHYYQLGYAQMKEEFQKNPQIQAILFPSDYHAMGAAAALKDLHTSAETVELFGMDDCVSSQFAGIPLTTTHFDVSSSVDLLMNQLLNNKNELQIIEGTIIHYPKPSFTGKKQVLSKSDKGESK